MPNEHLGTWPVCFFSGWEDAALRRPIWLNVPWSLPWFLHFYTFLTVCSLCKCLYIEVRALSGFDIAISELFAPHVWTDLFLFGDIVPRISKYSYLWLKISKYSLVWLQKYFNNIYNYLHGVDNKYRDTFPEILWQGHSLQSDSYEI